MLVEPRTQVDRCNLKVSSESVAKQHGGLQDDSGDEQDEEFKESTEDKLVEAEKERVIFRSSDWVVKRCFQKTAWLQVMWSGRQLGDNMACLLEGKQVRRLGGGIKKQGRVCRERG